MKDLLFINAKIVSPERIFEGTVEVGAGKIVKITDRPDGQNALRKGFSDFKGRVYDLQGKYLKFRSFPKMV